MEKKLYVIHTARKIHCLNHITGPIETPTPMDPLDVLELVRHGFNVEEVNPYNTKERVKVTSTNFNMIKFKTTEIEMIKRRKLNRELQEMAKAEDKSGGVPKHLDKAEVKATLKKEEKKDDKKEDPKPEAEIKEDVKKSDTNQKVDNSKKQTLSHTDFEKH